MKEYKGIPAARGFARGVALQWKDAEYQIPEFTPADLGTEKKRLTDARQLAEGQLHLR